MSRAYPLNLISKNKKSVILDFKGSRRENPASPSPFLAENREEYVWDMADRKLSHALANLVSRGELRQEDAEKVEVEFANLNGSAGLRRKVVSEVGGYLGGLFIVIALLILVNGRWHHLSRLAQFGIFISMAVLIFGLSALIGILPGARSRLTGLLNVAASTCVTVALITIKIPDHRSVALAISMGWFLVLVTFLLNKTIFGEISLALFSIATGISTKILLSPHPRNNSYSIATTFFVVGTIWLFLSFKRFFNSTLGSAIGMSMLFISGQFMFNGDYRFVTYLIYMVTVGAASWLYSRRAEWPLLAGSVLTITVGTGEFVGETLGGSVGAALGLLSSGILFITGSTYSFRRAKRQRSV